jgi:hypothetical protein
MVSEGCKPACTPVTEVPIRRYAQGHAGLRILRAQEVPQAGGGEAARRP